MGEIINMEKLSRLTVQIRKDQHKKLKDKAGPGVSISYLVRHAIDSTDIAPYSRVSFEQSSYSEYESNSIDGLKKIGKRCIQVELMQLISYLKIVRSIILI